MTMHQLGGITWVGFLGLAMITCGGTTEQDPDSLRDRSTGSGGVVTASGGTGATTVTGGAGGTVTPGAGGSIATGGDTPGSGGSGAAAAGGTVACPGLPDCNWCGGEQVYDAMGCPVGYVCANGVDPCATEPCSTSAECGTSAMCGFDALCWELDVSCDAESCVSPNINVCTCAYACSDGNEYEFQCEMAADLSSTSCNCVVNGQSEGSCELSGAGGSACEWGSGCCGFPE